MYLGFFILDPVGFINDHVPPSKLLKDSFLSNNHLIGSNTNIPFTWQHCIPDERSLKHCFVRTHINKNNKIYCNLKLFVAKHH